MDSLLHLYMNAKFPWLIYIVSFKFLGTPMESSGLLPTSLMSIPGAVGKLKCSVFNASVLQGKI